MKNYLRSGILVLVYAMSSPAFSSDTATLTISGRVTTPTCSTEVINSQLQQRCGNITQLLNMHEINATSSVRGVATEVVSVAGDARRQIVLNRYD